MKNKVYSGHTITAAQVAASVSGVPYDLGSGLVGVAVNSADANAENEYETSGVKRFANDGNAYAVGQAVDYAVAGATVIATTTGDFPLGVVTKAALAGEEVEVMVNGQQGPGPSYS